MAAVPDGLAAALLPVADEFADGLADVPVPAPAPPPLADVTGVRMACPLAWCVPEEPHPASSNAPPAAAISSAPLIDDPSHG
jgi:hypothetical protein